MADILLLERLPEERAPDTAVDGDRTTSVEPICPTTLMATGDNCPPPTSFAIGRC
jgi:hypothetical protein